MNPQSIRTELINWLTNLEDVNILTSMLQFKKANESADWADNLTPEQVQSLQKGLAEMKEGKTIDSKTFRASYGRKA